MDSPLAGRHQLRNIALAIATAEELGQFGFKVTPRQIEHGIRETHWPGRFQVAAAVGGTHQREMVLDVAHNPAGAWALRSALSETFPGRELTLVFAAMRDKAIQEMAEVLFPIAEQVVRDAREQSASRHHRRIAAGRGAHRDAVSCRGRRSPRRWREAHVA